jgi:hypothetical protein
VTKSDYLCNSRVCCRVRVTRRVEFTRRVQVWNYFPTRVHSRVTRRVKFSPNGYGYGWALPIGYVPVAIVTRGRPPNTRGRLPRVQHSGKAYWGSGPRGRGLPRVSNLVRSGKPFSSVVLPLGDDLTPSVPSPIFLFFYSSPSATLGEEIHFF